MPSFTVLTITSDDVIEPFVLLSSSRRLNPLEYPSVLCVSLEYPSVLCVSLEYPSVLCVSLGYPSVLCVSFPTCAESPGPPVALDSLGRRASAGTIICHIGSASLAAIVWNSFCRDTPMCIDNVYTPEPSSSTLPTSLSLDCESESRIPGKGGKDSKRCQTRLKRQTNTSSGSNDLYLEHSGMGEGVANLGWSDALLALGERQYTHCGNRVAATRMAEKQLQKAWMANMFEVKRVHLQLPHHHESPWFYSLGVLMSLRCVAQELSVHSPNLLARLFDEWRWINSSRMEMMFPVSYFWCSPFLIRKVSPRGSRTFVTWCFPVQRPILYIQFWITIALQSVHLNILKIAALGQ